MSINDTMSRRFGITNRAKVWHFEIKRLCYVERLSHKETTRPNDRLKAYVREDTTRHGSTIDG